MAWTEIGALEDLADGRGTRLRAGSRALAVFRLGGAVFAVDDRCPHRGLPLHDGMFAEGRVRCRTHGSTFRLDSGAVERGPAGRGVAVHPVEVRDGRVWVDLPD